MGLLASLPGVASAAAPVAAAAAAAAPAQAHARAVPADEIAVEPSRVDVPGGPSPADGTISLDTSLYLPSSATPATPAPAVLVAHGFGATKDSVDSDARELAARGYVVQTWTARGFGTSGGQIALNDPLYEVADASRLVDRLDERADVAKNGPGDPLVGVTGASYGGALSLLAAGNDPRIDAIVPVITWNDLGQALFPNNASTATLPADTPARGANAGDGVFKRGWAGVFFGSVGDPRRTDPSRPLNCGRFTLAVCNAYTEAATTGRLSAATTELLRRASPSSNNRITAPTLLVQGEQDTLFGLDQADANARQIAANGRTPVSVLWFAGGHDGGAPDAGVRARIGDWFDQYLRAGRNDSGGIVSAPPPTASDVPFAYQVQSGVRTRGDTPTGRTVLADSYPGLTGAASAAPVGTRSIGLTGAPQVVVHPAGGNPAAVTSLPGAGSALSSLGGLSGLGAQPGQAARFVSEPLPEATQIAGVPRVDVEISRIPGQPGGTDAVLFGSLSTRGADGRTTLLGNAVAPLRVAVPSDGSPARVTVTLPGVAAPVTAGSSLVVSLSTTDQGFDSGTAPSAWRVGPVDGTGLTVPVVPGRAEAADTVPVWALIGIAIALAAAALVWLVARTRRRRDPETVADDAPPLQVSGLAKTYGGGFRAVRDVSFTVERGMVLGLLGPNGAGKTTVLRMLMGLISPTAGEMRAFGTPVRPGGAVLSRIGAFVEGPGFLPHLSGAENLRLYWAATGRPPEQARMAEALEIAGLGDSVQRRVGTYSQGMRQRLAIAQAMLGLPELLMLDEPTNGLDPPQIYAMRELLRRYAEGGRTVLVSSHLLAEVEQTCTHVVVMHRGTVVADGTVDEIIAGDGGASFGVDAPDRAARVLDGLDGVRDIAVRGSVVQADLGGVPRSDAVAALVGAGVAVQTAGPRSRLEDAFLALVGENGEGNS
ncbi:ATP-binding cassette domain-containing protein [Pseudonocardia sp. KRD291]|uniref:ATP-binding cassette domain-containing protein n=1 Tax=Pseudonocardia sp. KRD291 TaxID=2792007 RepID=UPI0035AFAEA9